MTKRELAAVPKPPEDPPQRRRRHRQTDPEAVQAKERAKVPDSERDTLVFLKSELQKRIADAPTHAIARLIKEFREVDKELRILDAKLAREAKEGNCKSSADEAWDDDDL